MDLGNSDGIEQQWKCSNIMTNISCIINIGNDLRTVYSSNQYLGMSLIYTYMYIYIYILFLVVFLSL